jgi:hypothetical protein
VTTFVQIAVWAFVAMVVVLTPLALTGSWRFDIFFDRLEKRRPGALERRRRRGQFFSKLSLLALAVVFLAGRSNSACGGWDFLCVPENPVTVRFFLGMLGLIAGMVSMLAVLVIRYRDGEQFATTQLTGWQRILWIGVVMYITGLLLTLSALNA